MTSVAPGDHVIPLYTPECGSCNFCESGSTNLCQRIRVTQGQGVMPDGSSRFSLGGKSVHHYMGTSTFSEYTVLPEISLARINPRSASRQGLPARLRHYDRHRRGAPHRQGPPRRVGRRIRPRRDRAVRHSGRGDGRRRPHHRRRHQRRQIRDGHALGATDTVNPSDYSDPIQDVIVDLTDGGVDYSFECIGNVEVMRAALECCHKGWGESTIIGVAGAGQEISTRPFQLVTGRVWRGTAFGGVKGRSQLPGMVDQYLAGEIKVDEMITHRFGLEDINKAFDLMHEGLSIRSVIDY